MELLNKVFHKGFPVCHEQLFLIFLIYHFKWFLTALFFFAMEAGSLFMYDLNFTEESFRLV